MEVRGLRNQNHFEENSLVNVRDTKKNSILPSYVYNIREFRRKCNGSSTYHFVKFLTGLLDCLHAVLKSKRAGYRTTVVQLTSTFLKNQVFCRDSMNHFATAGRDQILNIQGRANFRLFRHRT